MVGIELFERLRRLSPDKFHKSLSSASLSMPMEGAHPEGLAPISAIAYGRAVLGLKRNDRGTPHD